MNANVAMNYVARLAVAVAVLVALLGSTPSWGAPPNPTASDEIENTAGGTGALQSADGSGEAYANTAFGFNALASDSTGDFNTASGAHALESNTTGNGNTARA